MTTPLNSDDLHQITWIVLTVVEDLQIGKIKLAQFLKGSESKNVKLLAGKATYAELARYDIPTIIGFIEQLENMDLIQRKIISEYPCYSILELTKAGILVLEEKRQIPLQIIKEVKPIVVGDSEKETYGLVIQGKNIREISEHRNLALSTIYTHLFRLIVNDYLQSADVIPEEIIKKVTTVADTLSKPTVKTVKELLPEIRCLLAGMKL